jgi:hypothetical protein
MGAKKTAPLVASQKAWLKERDRCATKESCLAESMSKRLVALKPPSSAGFEIVEHKGGSTEVSYPRLTTLGSTSARTKINARLLELAQLEGCASESGHWSVQSEAFHPTRRVFSVAMDFDWFCGGPYPEAYRQWLTFDLNTGEELTLDQIALDPKAAERIRERVRTAPVEQKDCKDPLESIDAETTLRIGIRSNGLAVRPSFPHVLRACEREVLIPTVELSRFLKKEFL